MSVARFIADQRAKYRVPHTVICALLGVSLAWFYKWIGRAAGPGAASGLHTSRDSRRDAVDRAVAAAFTESKGCHGSPRLLHDLRDDGWTISEKTVADSMRRQGLVARRVKRRNGLTRQDKTAPKFPDLVRRDFTAAEPNAKWVGDITEIPIGVDGSGPKLYLATVIDLYSRRLLGAATSLHPDAELACAAIKMAVATRGGKAAIWRDDESERVIFHTDRGSTYTANSFTKLCRDLGIRQSMDRVSSCFDNAAAEAFFSSLEWEVLSRHDFENLEQAQAIVLDWCYGFYNHDRRHSTIGMISPLDYENTAAPAGKPHKEPSTIRGEPQSQSPRSVVVRPGRLDGGLLLLMARPGGQDVRPRPLGGRQDRLSTGLESAGHATPKKGGAGPPARRTGAAHLRYGRG